MKKTAKTTAAKGCAKTKAAAGAKKVTASAPAAKKTGAAKPVAKTAAAPVKKTASAAVKPAAAPASAKKSSAKKVTRIVAHVDIGWGNMLYIRGEGAGLSWEQGVPMICNNGSEWHWIAETEDGPISFKFLVNDEKWALGENVTINAGDVHISDPAF